jgi:hypothetical protein
MTNSKRILFIIGILAILVVLMVLLWRTPQRHSWLETYKEDSREPFGTQVIFELLKSYFPGQTTKVIEDKLSEELPENLPDRAITFSLARACTWTLWIPRPC